MSIEYPTNPGVTIDSGVKPWTILQQDGTGGAKLTMSGRWRTAMKRKSPQVYVRIFKDGTFSPISRTHDLIRAQTVIDPAVTGDTAGKVGTWSLTIERVPCGGPYRIETFVTSPEVGLSGPRGESVHFVGVGDVWLIGGQSNASGTALSPIDDPSEIGVHEYLPHTGWRLAVHESYHHPWLLFAKMLKKELGYPIGLIPTAVGGSPISRWDPAQNGDLFADMVKRFKGAESGIRGVLWYQGESDVQPVDHQQYKARFKRYLAGTREMAGNPKLPIITVQLNRRTDCIDPLGWEEIREHQRQLSHELNDVFLISVFDSVLTDVIHNGSLGNLLIAQRTVETALGGVYGRDLHFRAPECVSATLTTADTIDLKFENVAAQLDYSGRPNHSFPFEVRDVQGVVPVKSFSIPALDTFRIVLARPLTGPATVVGAPGSCPPHNVVQDLSGYRGMLGFTLAVQTLG